MTPILLTEFGEELVDFGEDEQKSLSLVSRIGRHIHDEPSEVPVLYLVYLHSVSRTHNVVCCAKCGRIGAPIPKEVDTYRKLRYWCKDRIDNPDIPESLKRAVWRAMEKMAAELKDVPDGPQTFNNLSDAEMEIEDAKIDCT